MPKFKHLVDYYIHEWYNNSNPKGGDLIETIHKANSPIRFICWSFFGITFCYIVLAFYDCILWR